MRTHAPAAAQHAAVIGGSMAGLLAARVLAGHVARVTLIERDHFPAEPGPRKGVPQARHVHVLLVQGQRILEQLFPGIGAELRALGARRTDWTNDCLLARAGVVGPRFASDMTTLTCSRNLLEWAIRRRLRGLPNVVFLQGRAATGLVAEQGRVRGVWLQAFGDTARGERELLDADVVVDAGGRDSRAPDWLAELGYERPADTTINSFLGYASRVYRKPAGVDQDWKAVLIVGSAPGQPRGGVLYPIEHDRWHVTLVGAARDYPPTDEDGFRAFARSLDHPALWDAICDAEPVSPISGYRRTENRWRHFERLARWPDGLFVLGDAACAFNPVYGQGMTAGAIGALELDRCLRRRPGLPPGLARQFQRRLARANQTPWLLATGEDFRWPSTEGGRPGPATRLAHRYFDQLLPLLVVDRDVKYAFMKVTQLTAPPGILFQPWIAGRILAHRFRRRGARASAAAPTSYDGP